jgi:hypothetical protein
MAARGPSGRRAAHGLLDCGVTRNARRQGASLTFGTRIMKSTVGRPRILTDQQVAAILEWHDALLVWKAQRKGLKTQRQLAKELGVTTGAIRRVICQRGEFKQPSPEHRSAELSARRARRARLRTHE